MRTPATEEVHADWWDKSETVILRRRWSFLEAQENLLDVNLWADEAKEYEDPITKRPKDRDSIRPWTLIIGKIIFQSVTDWTLRHWEAAPEADGLPPLWPREPETFLHPDFDGKDVGYLLGAVRNVGGTAQKAQEASAAAGAEGAEGEAGFPVGATGDVVVPGQASRGSDPVRRNGAEHAIGGGGRRLQPATARGPR